ncbi:MAG: metallophosphoesterase [Deltaproteobacteria bacterium]|nr:metallophosphoesterase [Deltaproteobacteria bacterium]
MSQLVRFGVFFLTLSVVVGGLNVLVHRRVATSFQLGATARRNLGVLLGLGVLGMLLGRALGGTVGSTISGLALVLEVGVIVAALLFVVERLVVRVVDAVLARRLRVEAPAPARPVPPAAPAPDTVSPPDGTASAKLHASSGSLGLSRRDLLARASASAALMVGGGSAAYGGLIGRHDYELEEVPIRLAKLPRTLDGFTIAQLSDVHLGMFVGEREMARAVELVRRARPNLVAITGDMVDHDPAFADVLGRLTRMLGALAPVVVVPGNHDHYAGVDVVLDRVRRAAGTVLDNRHVRVGEGRIFVAGVDDLWARRFRLGRGPDLDAALQERRDDEPCVLLAHQPAFFEEAAERVDLQLSGHTHGGQFNLGVRPADYVMPHGWVAGRYAVGSSQLYVNRGFGTAGPPARVGAPPEVTRLVLTV